MQHGLALFYTFFVRSRKVDSSADLSLLFLQMPVVKAFKFSI
jgi:hypothetical protein